MNAEAFSRTLETAPGAARLQESSHKLPATHLSLVRSLALPSEVLWSEISSANLDLPSAATPLSSTVCLCARHGDRIITQSSLPGDASMHHPPHPPNKQHQMTKGHRAAWSKRKHDGGMRAGVGDGGRREYKDRKVKRIESRERNANSWTLRSGTEILQSYFDGAPYFRTPSQCWTAHFYLYLFIGHVTGLTCLPGGVGGDIFERSEYRSVPSRDRLTTRCTCAWPSIIERR